MTLRRGLTLIEVLAATVLLAVIAAVVVPLLRQSTEAMPRRQQSGVPDLNRIADEVMAHPGRFGIDALEEIDELTIDTAEAADGITDATSQTVHIRVRIRGFQTASSTGHMWLVFTWTDGHRHEWVVRWVPVAEEED